MRRIFAAALAAVALMATACSASDQASTTSVPPHSAPAPAVVAAPAAAAPAPDFRAIMALAPNAYTGPCAVEQRADGSWYQQGQDISGRSAPVPCANLYAAVGKTFATASPPNQVFNNVYTSTAGSMFVPTQDKLEVRVHHFRGSDDWLVTWSAKPGVHIEWLLASVTGGNFISAGSGHYYYHGRDASDYPSIGIYANDLDAPPGDPVGITGPPLPAP